MFLPITSNKNGKDMLNEIDTNKYLTANRLLNELISNIEFGFLNIKVKMQTIIKLIEIKYIE